LQIEDLKAVQAALQIKYQMTNGTHYQNICPQCRRKNLALAQDGLWRSTDMSARGLL
jgi:hypothetical protein